jgi:glucokinase
MESAIHRNGFSPPVNVENTANCCAIGEGMVGQAMGVKNYVVISIGAAGIACGVIADDRLVIGPHGMAGEAGHIVAKENSAWTPGGTDVTLENAASHGLPAHLDMLWNARNYGKPKEIIDDVMDVIARMATSVAHVFDPKMIIFGGELSVLEGFASEISKKMRPYPSDVHKNVMDIRISKLGFDTPLYGASDLWPTRSFVRDGQFSR